VNEFVEECRSEWKRLGVPDPVANEMASDLAADLEEAEAEGASAEEVLGSGAIDARSFATAWAAERGVIQRPLPRGHGLTRRSRLAAGIGTFALIIAITGAVLVMVASPSAPGRLALASPVDPSPGAVWVTRRDVPPPGPVSFAVPAPDGHLWRFAVDGRALRAVTLSVPKPGMDTNDSRVDSRTIGSVLLIVGLAGVVPSTLFLLWLGPSRGRAAVRRTTTV
jgi:hypothetical protein